MSLKSVIEILITVWPVLIVLAIVATLFIPDRVKHSANESANRKVEIFLTWTWVAALGWFLPIMMAQSIPNKGDIGAAPFWSVVCDVFAHTAKGITAPATVACLIAYAAGGLVWALVYFWVYARRLGQQYVMERDDWMRGQQLSSLAGVTAEQREDFGIKVLGKVKSRMLYNGDFPLRPLQQKRFFAANLTLWPATLLVYLLGDLAMDVARQIWFALRTWVRRHWEAGMAEYLADDKLCRSYLSGTPAG